jgi:hypothetical protein
MNKMDKTDLKKLVNKPYSAGFVTDLESDQAPPGLNEDIIRLISKKKKRTRVYAGVSFKSLSALVNYA